MCQPCTFDFGSLCADVGGVLKTCFCDLPKVVKSFYLSCSCGPACLEPKLDLILSAYGIHFYIYWISFIVGCTLWGLSWPGMLAANLGTPLFNAIVTTLSSATESIETYLNCRRAANSAHSSVLHGARGRAALQERMCHVDAMRTRQHLRAPTVLSGEGQLYICSECSWSLSSRSAVPTPWPLKSTHQICLAAWRTAHRQREQRQEGACARALPLERTTCRAAQREVAGA